MTKDVEPIGLKLGIGGRPSEEIFPNKLDNNREVVFCRFSKSAGSALVKALGSSSLVLSPQFAMDMRPKSRRNWLLQSLEEAAEKAEGSPIVSLKADLQAVEERLWRKRDKKAWTEYVEAESAKGINTFQLEWAVPEFFDDILAEYEVFTCMRTPFRRIEAEFCREQAHLYTYENGEYVPSPKPGQTCSSWIKETLYWKSDDSSEVFKVSVNKPNYHVRFLCGLSADPLTDVSNDHRGYLEKARRRLSKFTGIIILNDVDTYSLLRRWHYYERLKRVNVGYRKVREDLFDIPREEFELQNRLDYELFEYAKELTRKRLAKEERANEHREHGRSDAQDKVMAQTDIVIPIKERGLLLRTVLEALDALYKPRTLRVVTASTEIDWITKECVKWKVRTKIEVHDENELFASMGITRADMEACYSAATVGHTGSVSVKSREFGWWFQQVIKLGIGLLIPDISENYYVWDADLVPLKRWKLGDIGDDGEIKYFTAILQHSSRPGNAAEYAKCLKHTTGQVLRTPTGGGTFVTHHMAFNKGIVRELLEEITRNVMLKNLAFPVDCKGLWPLAIIGLSQNYPRFSEYLTYASYCVTKGEFCYHEFSEFGTNAIRLRGDTAFLPKLLASEEVLEMNPDVANGLSFEQFAAFAERFYRHSALPTVLQLDHVYTDLPEPSHRYWNYYESYAYGCVGITEKSYEESRVAKAKLHERMCFWWSLFERQGSIFLHIPRNAGSSVEAILLADMDLRASQHFSAMEWRDSDFKLFNKLLKFCTIRNPYDRIVSAWSYLRAGGNQKPGDMEWAAHLQQLGSFAAFVLHYFKNKTFQWNTYKLPVHFVPQHLFVTNEEGELLVDVCIEFEDFKNLGLGKLMKGGVSAEIHSQPAPRVRSSKRNKMHDEYTELTADIIYSVYEDDFILFGYGKDSWRLSEA